MSHMKTSPALWDDLEGWDRVWEGGLRGRGDDREMDPYGWATPAAQC